MTTALARIEDPQTSHAAAAGAARFAHAHERRIVAALTHPMTCYDLATATGLDHVAVARRMRNLVDAGAVVANGKAPSGPRGMLCTLWERVQ